MIRAESPFDNKMYYFVDKCLPFGASISCLHFQAFSDAIAHIMRHKSGKDNMNYLDDFLFIALLKAMCDGQIKMFLKICESINFPVSLERTQWSSTQIIFLGFLIDTVRQLVLILVEKINKGKELIEGAIKKRKITMKQIQQICRFLNFLGRCIVPGRAFTRWLYAFTEQKQAKLKQHHHIRLTAEIKNDLNMWAIFLNHPTAYAQHFIDFSRNLKADQVEMLSDAAKSDRLGFRAVCKNSWVFAQWPGNFIHMHNPSIEYLKLYALVIGVVNWLHRYKNRRIIIFCDIQSVVHMVNNTSSSCNNCMVLMRRLVLECLKYNIRVFARYIRSRDNKASDYLSRMRIQDFKQLKSTWDEQPTAIPEDLWPVQKLWIN